VLYANSSFPLEIVENKFFVGNNFHGNSEVLRKDLEISYVIDIKQDEELKFHKIDKSGRNITITINKK